MSVPYQPPTRLEDVAASPTMPIQNAEQRISNQFSRQSAISQAAGAYQAYLNSLIRSADMEEDMRRQHDFLLPLQLLNAQMGLTDNARRVNQDYGPNIARQTFFSGI